MKVFPYAYSMLDTYHKTFPKESARMTQDSSLHHLRYEKINHKSSIMISKCSPCLQFQLTKVFPILHHWLSACMLTVCTEMH